MLVTMILFSSAGLADPASGQRQKGLCLMELTCEHCGMAAAAADRFCANCGQVPSSDPGAAPAFTQVPPQASGSWPGRLAGSAIPADPALTGRGPNDYYRGRRLSYDQVPEGSFDTVFNSQLLWQFFLRGLLYLLVYLVAGAASAIV